MPPRNHRNLIYSFLWEIGHSPHRLLQSLQFILLGLFLLVTLVGFGGFLPYGESMMGVTKFLLLLTGVHAFSTVVGRDRPGLEWELILPIPFLVYAWAHYQFLSTAPWASGPFLAVLVQAYAIYFLVFNSIHSVRSGRWVLNVSLAVVAIALLTGFFNFYMFPDWIPAGDRMRNPAYQQGAAGFLQDPANLGALLVGFLPVFTILAAKHLRTGPVWILHGFFAFVVLVGTFLSVNRSGLAVTGVVLLVLPIFLTESNRRRRQLWFYGILIIAVLGGVTWFGTDDLRERIVFFLNSHTDALGSMSRAVATAQFLDNPLFGQGLGAFHLFWHSHLSAPVPGTAYYAVSAAHGLLAETGLTGFLLAIGPVALLLYLGFKDWLGIPFLQLNRDESQRVSRLSPRQRRRSEQQNGRMPYQKAVLAGAGLGLAALIAYSGWDYFLQLPFGLFIFACLAAILAAFRRDLQRPAAQGKYWMATACTPFVLALWVTVFGLPRFYADYLNYTGGEYLQHLQEEPDLVFSDPGALSTVEASFRGALELVPGHGEALTNLGTTRLLHLNVGLESPRDVAEAALPILESAVEIAPMSWLAHYNLVRTRLILGGAPAAVETMLDRAIELAPFRPEPVALKGCLRLLAEPGSAEAVALIEKALEIAPGYEPAARAFNRIQFRQGTPGEGFDKTGQGLMTAPVLAQQFTPMTAGQERVLGAGLPEFVDFIPELPETAE